MTYAVPKPRLLRPHQRRLVHAHPAVQYTPEVRDGRLVNVSSVLVDLKGEVSNALRSGEWEHGFVKGKQ